MTEQGARERVIRAMCPDRVCRVCGEPSRRIVEKSERYEAFRAGMSTVAPSEWTAAVGNRAQGLPSQVGRSKMVDGSEFTAAEYVTVGFTDCGHDDWRPGVWIDPFQTEEGFMLTLGNIDEK